MRPEQHLIIGFAVGSMVLLLTPPLYNLPNLLPWLLGSTFPDVDHLFRYGVKHKTINIKKLVKLISTDFYINNQHIYPLHTAEFLLFSLLYFRHRIYHFYYWFAAYLIHLFVDMARLYKTKRNFSWVRKWSLIWALRKYYA